MPQREHILLFVSAMARACTVIQAIRLPVCPVLSRNKIPGVLSKSHEMHWQAFSVMSIRLPCYQARSQLLRRMAPTATLADRVLTSGPEFGEATMLVSY